MQAVPNAIGTYTGQLDANNLGADPTVVIDCDDAGLQPVTNNNFYVFDDRFGVYVEARNGQRPCLDPAVLAYRYLTNSARGPKFVIVICASTIGRWFTNPAQPYIGSGYHYKNWYGEAFDQFQYFTSNSLLHEFIHCITLPQPPGATVPWPNTIGTTLPFNAGDEVYSFAEISALLDAAKPFNANGYSILGTALWLYYNKLSPSGKMSSQYPENQRPPRGPHQ